MATVSSSRHNSSAKHLQFCAHLVHTSSTSSFCILAMIIFSPPLHPPPTDLDAHPGYPNPIYQAHRISLVTLSWVTQCYRGLGRTDAGEWTGKRRYYGGPSLGYHFLDCREDTTDITPALPSTSFRLHTLQSSYRTAVRPPCITCHAIVFVDRSMSRGFWSRRKTTPPLLIGNQPEGVSRFWCTLKVLLEHFSLSSCLPLLGRSLFTGWPGLAVGHTH